MSIHRSADIGEIAAETARVHTFNLREKAKYAKQQREGSQSTLSSPSVNGSLDKRPASHNKKKGYIAAST